MIDKGKKNSAQQQQISNSTHGQGVIGLSAGPALIVGCGDVGLRIAKRLGSSNVSAFVSSAASCDKLQALGISSYAVDLDQAINVDFAVPACVYYLVPPQAEGDQDQRSQHFLQFLLQQGQQLERVVLISTTGVYGDQQGDWVTEDDVTEPLTGRGQRRLSLEQQWRAYAQRQAVSLSILRVPGIYSFSRLPRQRLLAGTPIVDPRECGYTNRIHADDLAMICTEVMRQQSTIDIFNVSDGTPGKISEYLLEAANTLNITPPQLISMAQAEEQVSAGMMSYLRESRRIDNSKLLQRFSIKLRYPDFKIGMRN